MTYLNLVNKVLKKLREDTVSSVDYSNYSALVGEYVNDAKKEVENAWDWSALRTAVTFSSIIGTRVYDVSDDTNEDARLIYDECGRPMAFDTTTATPIQLIEMEEDRMEREYILQYPTQTIDQPCYFSLTQLGDGYQVNFLETPSKVRSYKFYFICPQDDLEEDSDTLTVPWRPVRDLAVIYALSERGEEIGEPGSVANMKYMQSLSAAIAFDAKKDPRKTIFVVP